MNYLKWTKPEEMDCVHQTVLSECVEGEQQYGSINQDTT